MFPFLSIFPFFLDVLHSTFRILYYFLLVHCWKLLSIFVCLAFFTDWFENVECITPWLLSSTFFNEELVEIPLKVMYCISSTALKIFLFVFAFCWFYNEVHRFNFLCHHPSWISSGFWICDFMPLITLEKNWSPSYLLVAICSFISLSRTVIIHSELYVPYASYYIIIWHFLFCYFTFL
jgi:hypothetical protein